MPQIDKIAAGSPCQSYPPQVVCVGSLTGAASFLGGGGEAGHFLKFIIEFGWAGTIGKLGVLESDLVGCCVDARLVALQR